MLATLTVGKKALFYSKIWNFWTVHLMWVGPVDEMLASLDFGRWQVSCLGCLEGTWTWISRYFSPKMIRDFLFLMFFRLRRLHLTSPEELRNWGCVGGSIDSLNYSCIFQYDSIYFYNFVSFQIMIELTLMKIQSFSCWGSPCWPESPKMSQKPHFYAKFIVNVEGI